MRGASYFDEEFGAKYINSSFYVPPAESLEGEGEEEDDDPTNPEIIKSVKRLPDWLLVELSAFELRKLIAGLHRADGAFAQDDKVIYTSGVRFRDQLMHALILCGFSPWPALRYTAGTIRAWKWHDQTVDRKVYTTTFYDQLEAEEKEDYRPIKATADGWTVTWAAMGSANGTASCQPILSRSQHISSAPYASRNGRSHLVRAGPPRRPPHHRAASAP